jgi:hypothetical protein
MKRFQCSCGGPIFFDNHQCLQCGARVGFDPESMSMVPVEERADQTYCENYDHSVCNWLRPIESANALCQACRFNRTIPNLNLPHNAERWAALERAKKRLFFSFYRLELPVTDGWHAGRQGLLFDFLDDARTQPETYPDTFITSGFAEGVITINVLEADDIARTTAQVELRERYRTLLGHFRHESGHYFWSLLSGDEKASSMFGDLFGDANAEYRESLNYYYEIGPPIDWEQRYISAYASSHPLEDWAETWSHYLLMHDALETAHSHGLIPTSPSSSTFVERISQWQAVSVGLNEMNQSVGREDAYPFVISTQVRNKLAYVDAMISRLRTLQ